MRYTLVVLEVFALKFESSHFQILKQKLQEQLACNAPSGLRIFDNSRKTTYIGNQICRLLVCSDSTQLQGW